MGNFYEVSLVVEGYKGSGTANVKMSMSSGKTTVNSKNSEINSNSNNVINRSAKTQFNVIQGTKQIKNIPFNLQKPSYVSLKVYNFLEETIASVGDKEYSSGRYSFAFDASNLAHGVYFYSIKTGYY